MVGLTAALTAAMGVGPFVMYVLSVLGPYIVEALDLSKTAFGSLSTVGFVAGALTSLLLQRHLDGGRVHVQMYALSGTCIVSLALLTTTPGFLLALVAVVLSGVGQGLSTPVTNRVVSREITRNRGSIIGIKQSGVQVAQIVAALLLPGIAYVAGWRAAAATGLLVVGLCLVLAIRFVPRRDERVGSAGGGGITVTGGRLPAAVWWLAAYSFAMGAAIQGSQVHLPLFGVADLGMSVTAAATIPAVGGVVGVVSRIAWGRVADRTPHVIWLLVVMSILAVLAGVLNVVAVRVGHGWITWVATAVFGLGALASNGLVMLAVVNQVDGKRVGKATALVAFGLYAGFASGPVAVGAIADRAGSYLPALEVIVGLYAASLLVALGWGLADRRRGELAAPRRAHRRAPSA